MRDRQKIIYPLFALVLVVTLGASVANAQGVLFVKDNRVGIGVATPTQLLQVRSATGNAQVFVEETASGEHVLFSLANPGKTRFQVTNVGTGSWTFDVDNANRFTISRVGSGANEILVTPTGNMTIQGTLTEGSSRETKNDIVDVKGADILDRVLDLPISEWSYEKDRSGSRHLGPMAEDFHASFGLGDSGRGLASLDTSGVALAAIQGLNSKLERENAMLRTELEELRATVDSFVSKR
jgi:hypothetical protein